MVKTNRFEIRVEDDFLERLDQYRGGVSRSEVARQLLEVGLDTVLKKPVQFSSGEKIILQMLTDIYKSTSIKHQEVDPDFLMSAIYGGHLWAIEWEMTGLIHSHEDKRHEVKQVVDILDMWLFLEIAYNELSDVKKNELLERLGGVWTTIKFTGFDGNNETTHLGIARFMIEKMRRFEHFDDRDLNSHIPSLEGHLRMLDVFNPIRKELVGRALNVDEIFQIYSARLYSDGPLTTVHS